MTDCSIIMVSYHTGPVLFVSVKNALIQEQLAELIVVDNGNPPDVLARLQQIALTDSRLKVVSGGGNSGFAKGCNLGVKQAVGDYLLLLKPNCLLPPEALADFMQALEEVPDARLATGFLRSPDGYEQLDDRRELLTPAKIMFQVLGLSACFMRRRKNTPMTATEPYELSAISSACMCLRRKDYNRLGGMDEGFFLPVAGLDLCMRIHKNNGKIICVPRIRITHMPSHGRSLPAHIIQWQRAKGLARYFTKHFQREYVPGFLLVVNVAVLVRGMVNMAVSSIYQWIKPKRLLTHSVAVKKLMVLASGIIELPQTKELYGKTVLVTGATSQIGLSVIRRLMASGAAVLAISRSDPIPFEHKNLRWIKGDMTDNTLHLQGYLIDMVVHCAPLWHLPSSIELLAEAEVRHIVAFSSTSIFGKVASRNAHEKHMVEQFTKSEQDMATCCAEKSIEWTILRPTLVYGAGLDLSVTSLAKFIDRFGFFPVYPPAFGRRQPVHVDDLALAALEALTTAVTCKKSYNLSGGEVLTYRQMLERLFMLCRKKPKIIEITWLPFILSVLGWLSRQKHINGEIARRMNDDLVFFHDDASRDFGFKPRPFLSGGLKDIEGF